MDKYTRHIAEGNLFRDELFIIPEKKGYTLEGSYDFPLLMVFNQDKLTDENQQFLNSILQQVPFDNTVSLVNIGSIYLAKKQYSLLELVNQFQPKYIFTWGCEGLISGCPQDLLTPIYLGDLGLIHCPNLLEVEQTKSHKSELWQGMKVLFNIK